MRNNLTDCSLTEACADITQRLRNNSDADPLEVRALLAIIDDRKEEANLLLNVMTKRNNIGLTTIKGGKESQPQPV